MIFNRMRCSLLLAAVAATCPTADVFAAPPAYVATLIPTLGGGSSYPSAINAAGDVVGTSYVADYVNQRAFLFTGGVSKDLGTLGGGVYSFALGINRHREVVGDAHDGSVMKGFLHKGGAMMAVATPACCYSSAAAINDRGHIAGQYQTSTGVGNAYVLANGVFTDLGGLDPSGGSWAKGINNKDEVAGGSFVGGSDEARAFFHSNGVMHDLGPPRGIPLNSDGFAINELAQVTGLVQLEGLSDQAFISTNGAPLSPIGTLVPGASSAGHGINAAGQVVGWATLGIKTNASHAFLYDGGAMYDLNTLVVSGLGGREITVAHGINDSGQIAATACDPYSGMCQAVRLDPITAGIGNVSANPYGPLAVTGGTLVGNTLTLTSSNAELQLGTNAGAQGSLAVIDFQGLNLGRGSTLTVRSGAPGQTLVLANAQGNATTIAGTLVAAGSPPPVLILRNVRGIAVAGEGRITAPSGLVVDALDADWITGEAILNHGVVDGGAGLRLLGSAVNGSGTFKGNAIEIATFGNANNPASGVHFLANGLALAPSTGGDVALTLNDYGPAPQFINLAVQGNATVSMPSSWPTGVANPANNAPVLPGQFRAAGVPDPAYGGGSIIVQATGMLKLDGGISHDFVFAGGIVLKAGTGIDFNGVTVDNGWTTSGKPFQGQFHEAPIIMSSGPIDVRTSNPNWINFSVRPKSPVRSWQLVRLGNGSAQFNTADSIAPHLNTYSILVEAAATGSCWVCLMDLNPADLD